MYNEEWSKPKRGRREAKSIEPESQPGQLQPFGLKVANSRQGTQRTLSSQSAEMRQKQEQIYSVYMQPLKQPGLTKLKKNSQRRRHPQVLTSQQTSLHSEHNSTVRQSLQQSSQDIHTVDAYGQHLFPKAIQVKKQFQGVYYPKQAQKVHSADTRVSINSLARADVPTQLSKGVRNISKKISTSKNSFAKLQKNEPLVIPAHNKAKAARINSSLDNCREGDHSFISVEATEVQSDSKFLSQMDTVQRQRQEEWKFTNSSKAKSRPHIADSQQLGPELSFDSRDRAQASAQNVYEGLRTGAPKAQNRSASQQNKSLTYSMFEHSVTQQVQPFPGPAPKKLLQQQLKGPKIREKRSNLKSNYLTANESQQLFTRDYPLLEPASIAQSASLSRPTQENKMGLLPQKNRSSRQPHPKKGKAPRNLLQMQTPKQSVNLPQTIGQSRGIPLFEKSVGQESKPSQHRGRNTISGSISKVSFKKDGAAKKLAPLGHGKLFQSSRQSEHSQAHSQSSQAKKKTYKISKMTQLQQNQIVTKCRSRLQQSRDSQYEHRSHEDFEPNLFYRKETSLSLQESSGDEAVQLGAFGRKKILASGVHNSHRRSLRSSRNDSLEVINRRSSVTKRGKAILQGAQVLDSKHLVRDHNESSEVKLSHDYAHSEDPVVVGNSSEMLMEVTSNIESVDGPLFVEKCDTRINSESNSPEARGLNGNESASLVKLHQFSAMNELEYIELAQESEANAEIQKINYNNKMLNLQNSSASLSGESMPFAVASAVKQTKPQPRILLVNSSKKKQQGRTPQKEEATGLRSKIQMPKQNRMLLATQKEPTKSSRELIINIQDHEVESLPKSRQQTARSGESAAQAALNKSLRSRKSNAKSALSSANSSTQKTFKSGRKAAPTNSSFISADMSSDNLSRHLPLPESQRWQQANLSPEIQQKHLMPESSGLKNLLRETHESLSGASVQNRGNTPFVHACTIEDSTDPTCQGGLAHLNTINDICLVPRGARKFEGGSKFFTCSQDSTVKSWSMTADSPVDSRTYQRMQYSSSEVVSGAQRRAKRTKTTSLAFFGQHDLLVTAGTDRFINVFENRVPQALSSLDYSLLHKIPKQGSSVVNAMCKLDSDKLVVGQSDEQIHLYSLGHLFSGVQAPSSTFRFEESGINNLCSLNDSNVFISSGLNRSISVWDTRHPQPVLFFKDIHYDTITSIDKFNEQIFASASDDGYVNVWDLRMGEFVKQLKVDKNERISQINFVSPSLSANAEYLLLAHGAKVSVMAAHDNFSSRATLELNGQHNYNQQALGGARGNPWEEQSSSLLDLADFRISKMRFSQEDQAVYVGVQSSCGLNSVSVWNIDFSTLF